ncbi:LOW QUALITY PROTEIN: uncharacterized protein Dyak_GE17967 [Drosophila yakuba]|uniref:Uncharacterized protein n=1 Tax=Drosophila yakuba TaxID=7245 RepID=B4NYQ9_DROYA|nr:LOW QUALITY PROTEIN: uncharacterized protein Dyak_GE17967 [Drosophila yakuba]
MMLTVSMKMMMMMMMGNTGSWSWEQLSLKAFPFFDALMKCKIICLNGQKLSLDKVGMPLLWVYIKMNLISIPGHQSVYVSLPRENYGYDTVIKTPKGAAENEKAILTGSHFPHH